MSVQDFRIHGEQLAPGIYMLGDSLYVDLAQLILASGGDPSDENDVTRAREVVAELCVKRGIAVEEREDG